MNAVTQKALSAINPLSPPDRIVGRENSCRNPPAVYVNIIDLVFFGLSL